jgi:hypothetical protein
MAVRRALLLSIVSVTARTACPFVPYDRVWWPVVRNDFDEAIDIHIEYSNGASRTWHTRKGQCVITGIPQGSAKFGLRSTVNGSSSSIEPSSMRRSRKQASLK